MLWSIKTIRANFVVELNNSLWTIAVYALSCICKHLADSSLVAHQSPLTTSAMTCFNNNIVFKKEIDSSNYRQLQPVTSYNVQI